MNRAFSAGPARVRDPGASPQAANEAAPLALENNDVGLVQAGWTGPQLSTLNAHQKSQIRGIRAIRGLVVSQRSTTCRP